MTDISQLWTPPSGRLAVLTEDDKAELEDICSRQLDPSLVPLAEEIQQRVPIYSFAKLQALIRTSDADRAAVLDEFHRVLSIGPGFFVVRNLVSQDVIDRTEEVAVGIHEKYPPKGGGSLSSRTSAFCEKHAVADAESYADYYGNEVLAAAAEAWLGPAWKILTDLNLVTRGNTQPIHRDYPLSHCPTDRIPLYPIMNQMASQLQTLQGAVAHTDMPLATGPTRLCPFSHQFRKGYMALKRPDFIAIADRNMSQLPLKRGDAVFFNPAVYHQPGVNETDGARQACLFQISCAWNVQMELLDRNAMTKSVWPVIKRWSKEVGTDGADVNNGGKDHTANGHAHTNGHTATEYANGNGYTNGHASKGHTKRHAVELDALIAATCDDFGYAFNWRTVKSQQTQAQLIREALKEEWDDEEVMQRLDVIASATRF